MVNLPDEALDLLDRQFGAIGRFQLLDWMGPGQIEGYVRREALVPDERGVYRVRGGASSPEQRAMAAVLRARPKARVTGPLVLALLNVDGIPRDSPFEVLTAPGRQLTGVEFAHRPDPTPDVGRAKHKGLSIVTPTIALVDSPRFIDEIGERRLRVALDVCRWRKLTSTDEVLARAHLLGPDDLGAAFFLELLQDAPEAESDGERLLAEILAVFDPAPEAQAWVTPNRRADFFWRIYRLVIEYFGAVDHAYAFARARDAERSAELSALALQVVPVVAADLDDREALLAYLASVATARAHELGLPPPVRRDRVA